MVIKNTISMDSENELSAQMFSEAADDIASCSNDLLLVAEVIAQSCLMIGTTGDDYREVLTSRVKDFRTLAGLYKTRSRKFENIVKRLVGGVEDVTTLVENVLAKEAAKKN